MAGEERPAHVVTLAALYCAGGSVIGPRVADRLAVPFLDREIPEAVAKRTGLPERAVEDVDERARSAIDRITWSLGRASVPGGAMAASAEIWTWESAGCAAISRTCWPG
jgi:Cytidylate kinase-like family